MADIIFLFVSPFLVVLFLFFIGFGIHDVFKGNHESDRMFGAALAVGFMIPEIVMIWQWATILL